MVLSKLYNDNQFEKVKMDKLVSHYAPIYPKNKSIIAAQYHRRQVVQCTAKCILPSNTVSYLLLHSLPIQHLLEEICLHQLVS